MTATTSRFVEVHIGGGEFQEVPINYHDVADGLTFFDAMMAAFSNNGAQLCLRYASLPMAQFALRHNFNDIHRLLLKPPDIFLFGDRTAAIDFNASDGGTILVVLTKWLAPKPSFPMTKTG